MGKKKGNTLIIMLAFLFLFGALIGSYILINRISSNQINKFVKKVNDERVLENDAYKFYLLNIKEDDNFILDENYIIYKKNTEIIFFVFEENMIIKIRKEGK